VRCLVKRFFDYLSGMAAKNSQERICFCVAEILRHEREKRGLSMNQVAERAGLSQQMVSYVERQMRNPTLETVLRIAAAIEIDFIDVLKQATKSAKK
jgi:transcriptional regulator with XRE-family HTH domain